MSVLTLKWAVPNVSEPYVIELDAKDFTSAPELVRLPQVPWAGKTFRAFDPFTVDVPRAPDVFLWVRWMDGDLNNLLALEEVAFDFVIANGRIGPKTNKALCAGTLQGTFSATLGDKVLVKPTAFTIADGRSKVVQVGPEPKYSAPIGWAGRITRYAPAPDWPGWADLEAACSTLNPMFDFSKYIEPDEAGSIASCAFEWEGAVAAAILEQRVLPLPTTLLPALRKWVGDYAERPFLWYGPTGDILRASENPDIHVDESGWVLQAHGDWQRTSSGPQWPDIEHRVGRRTAAAWWIYGEPVARFFLEAEAECLMTKPEGKVVKPMENTRMRGYLAEELAEAVLIFGGARPQFKAGLLLQIACMQLGAGWAGGIPYPARGPTHNGHPDHIFVSAEDCWQFAEQHGWLGEVSAEWRKAPDGEPFRKLFEKKGAEDFDDPSYYTTGDHGPWGMLRGWVVWMLAIAIRGACRAMDALDVPKEAPKLPALIRHWVACITGPGRGPAIDGAHKPIPVVTVLDSLSSLVPSRGDAVYSAYNSTTPWIVAPLYMALTEAPGAPDTPEEATMLAGGNLAGTIYANSTELHWPKDAAKVLRVAFPALAFGGLNNLKAAES